MRYPKICVLLAAYNGQDYISEQLYSILHQEKVSITIYISVDLSTDNTLEAISEFVNKYPNVYLLEHSNRFGNACLNFFYLINNVDFIQYDYVAFADQDDIWLSSKLRRAVDMIIANNVNCYASSLIPFSCFPLSVGLLKKSGNLKKLDYLFQGASAGCTYVLDVNTAILVKEKINLLDTYTFSRPSHDWTIYAIARSYAKSWFIDSEYSGIFYRQHSNNQYGQSGFVVSAYKKYNMITNSWYKNHILFLEPSLTMTDDERYVYKYLKNNNMLSKAKLAINVFRYRRSFFSSIFLFFIIFFLF